MKKKKYAIYQRNGRLGEIGTKGHFKNIVLVTYVTENKKKQFDWKRI